MSPPSVPEARLRTVRPERVALAALAAGAAGGTVTSLLLGRGFAVVAAVVLLAQLSIAALAMVRDAHAKIAALRAELEIAKAERVVVIDGRAVEDDDEERVAPVHHFSRPPPIPRAA